MSPPQSAADLVRLHMGEVARLRQQVMSDGMQSAVQEIKSLQARRFRGTYHDFLEVPRFAPATRFFLDELYGVHDFAQRDAQFSRIAGALERLFPQAVAQLAVDLAETHLLTEKLDHEMATHWVSLDPSMSLPTRYIMCWRLTGSRSSRLRQLAVVQHMGLELQRLTRMTSLRMGLRMMRRPARAAGLDALQQFLESGFEAFSALGDADAFLDEINMRETAWVNRLFESPLDSCGRLLAEEIARSL